MTEPGLRVLFRADASASIGAGHLARCATLAHGIRTRGGHTTLLCAAGSLEFAPAALDAMDQIIELPFHGADVSSPAPEEWIEHSEFEDARMCLDAVGDDSFDWVVVDHYGLGTAWQTSIRGACGTVMAIDDLANRTHACDVLLDQNVLDEASPYTELVPATCTTLLGPRYALLRQEFTDARRARGLAVRKEASRILISFGGVDAANGTALALEAVRQSQLPMSVDVIVGRSHPDLAGIESSCRRWGFTLHVQTSNMAEIISSCDVAIGASGASSWERCFLGLPTLMITMAPNQATIGRQIANHGAGVFVGDWPDVDVAAISSPLVELQTEPGRLEHLSRSAYALMEGHIDVAELMVSGLDER